jgi:hypothetical protein
MKISRFNQYIKENQYETPESYIGLALKKLKGKIDKIFDYEYGEDLEDTNDKDLKPEDVRVNDKESSDLSFKDLGIQLQSCEISKYSKTHDTLTVKFNDSEFAYTIIFMIDIKQALPKNTEEDFNVDSVEKCYVKFKKYDLDTFDIVGQLGKNVKIKNIDEEFLINLKIEMDDLYDGDEEFEIE